MGVKILFKRKFLMFVLYLYFFNRNVMKYIIICLLLSFSFGVTAKIKVGADQQERLVPLLRNKRVGLVVNHTSVLSISKVHLLDTLLNQGIKVQAIFAPEHGFRGEADAGESVKNSRDVKTGVPVISLYGNNKKPTVEQFSNIDILVFDIQDVGARFYTYISTGIFHIFSI